MKTALVIIGIFSITAMVFGIIAWYVIVPAIQKAFEPEEGSNEALKNWLLSHPGADIDDYLHNKKDRCVIR